MRRVPTDDERKEGSDERGEQSRRQGLAYQGAFEAVAAIPISTGLGYWLDGRFDTSPYLLILGAAVGFAAFVTRLLRLGRQLQAFDPTDRPESDGSSRGGGDE
jgi:F0F1-type ATP synthase assembly protein I